MDEVRLDLGGEDRRLERDVLRLRRPWRRARVPSEQPSAAHLDEAVLGPGTEPLTSSRFRSASTLWTVRPSWVTRLPPIRPAIFMPLNTREGVAEAPIEPGARTLCEPWPRGPLEKLWRLIVPWKPLPIPIAGDLDLVARLERLDRDRLALDRAVEAAAELDERAVGADAGRFRCPSSGFVTFRSGTGSNASCTPS